MTASDRDATPALNPMYRFQWEPAQESHVLLYPEGMVKLSGSAGEIMQRIDGKTTIGGIIDDLKKAFPGVDLDADIINFLTQARANGWITY